MSKRYKCATCGFQGQLYRAAGEFLRVNRIKCKKHVPQKSWGWYVPLRIDPIDNGVWGHTSGPAESVLAWKCLPSIQIKPLYLSLILTLMILAGEIL